MAKFVPKNYKCYNCGREQYTKEKCYGCNGEVFIKLQHPETETQKLRKQLHKEIDELDDDILKVIAESIGLR